MSRMSTHNKSSFSSDELNSRKRNRNSPRYNEPDCKKQKVMHIENTRSPPFQFKRSSIYKYEYKELICESTFGKVFKASGNDGRQYAIKKLKLTERDKKDGLYLREIEILYSLNHRNIVRLCEVAENDQSQLFLVFPFYSYDLKKLLRETTCLSVGQAKNFLYQLLEGLQELHSKNIVHRDLKPANVLVGDDGILRICDLGSARKMAERFEFTPGLVTLWYRPPEILLGAQTYDTSVDLWSVGCIFAELASNRVLFDGPTEIMQLGKIFSVLGHPTNETWPGFENLPHARLLQKVSSTNILRRFVPSLSDSGFDLLIKLLSPDPRNRISAAEAMVHPYFSEFPLPAMIGCLPSPISAHSSPLSPLFDN